jgi:hypothetical protein
MLDHVDTLILILAAIGFVVGMSFSIFTIIDSRRRSHYDDYKSRRHSG